MSTEEVDVDALFDGVVEPSDQAYVDNFLTEAGVDLEAVSVRGHEEQSYSRSMNQYVRTFHHEVLYKEDVIWRTEINSQYPSDPKKKFSSACKLSMGQVGIYLRTQSGRKLKSKKVEKKFLQVGSLIRASAAAYQLFGVEEEIGAQDEIIIIEEANQADETQSQPDDAQSLNYLACFSSHDLDETQDAKEDAAENTNTDETQSLKKTVSFSSQTQAEEARSLSKTQSFSSYASYETNVSSASQADNTRGFKKTKSLSSYASHEAEDISERSQADDARSFKKTKSFSSYGSYETNDISEDDSPERQDDGPEDRSEGNWYVTNNEEDDREATDDRWEGKEEDRLVYEKSSGYDDESSRYSRVSRTESESSAGSSSISVSRSFDSKPRKSSRDPPTSAWSFLDMMAFLVPAGN